MWVNGAFSEGDRRRHWVEIRTGAICEPERMRVPADPGIRSGSGWGRHDPGTP